MLIQAKICGISTLSAAQAAIRNDAAYLGFIHFARSPRHIELDDMAKLMQAIRADGAVQKLVSVVVDPDDAMLETLQRRVKPNLIQLHGKETPERVAEIRKTTGTPVIKALSISKAVGVSITTSQK